MGGISIQFKAILVILACLAVAVLAGSAVAGSISERALEAAAGADLRGAAEAFAVLERRDVEKLTSTVDALLARDDLREAFSDRERARLASLAAPLFRLLREQDGITHWYFIEPEPDPRVFFRAHRPELFGDRVGRPTLLRAIETKTIGFGKELGRTAFALRVVRPMVHDGKLVGYMELGEEIGHFLRRMKAQTGDDYGMLVKKKYLDEQAWAAIAGDRPNTWKNRRDVVLVDATSAGQGIGDYQGDLEEIPDQGEVLEETVRGGQAMIRGIFPMRDAAGRKVGALFVVHDFTPRHTAIESGRREARVVVLAVAVALSAILYLTLHWLVFARVSRLLRAAQALSSRLPERAFGAGPEIIVAHGDELSQLEAFFERFREIEAEREAPRARASGDP